MAPVSAGRHCCLGRTERDDLEPRRWVRRVDIRLLSSRTFGAGSGAFATTMHGLPVIDDEERPAERHNRPRHPFGSRTRRTVTPGFCAWLLRLASALSSGWPALDYIPCERLERFSKRRVDT